MKNIYPTPAHDDAHLLFQLKNTGKMKAQRYLCPKAKKSISPKTCEAWTCKTPKANGAITAWHVPKTSSSLGKRNLVNNLGQTLLSWKDIP